MRALLFWTMIAGLYVPCVLGIVAIVRTRREPGRGQAPDLGRDCPS